MEPENRLHDYLIRYLILFFDFGYGESTFLDDYIRQFMNSHREFNFPESKSTINMEEAGNIFDVPAKDLEGMSKKQLTRLYRKKGLPMAEVKTTPVYFYLFLWLSVRN